MFKIYFKADILNPIVNQPSNIIFFFYLCYMLRTFKLAKSSIKEFSSNIF